MSCLNFKQNFRMSTNYHFLVKNLYKMTFIVIFYIYSNFESTQNIHLLYHYLRKYEKQLEQMNPMAKNIRRFGSVWGTSIKGGVGSDRISLVVGTTRVDMGAKTGTAAGFARVGLVGGTRTANGNLTC